MFGFVIKQAQHKLEKLDIFCKYSYRGKALKNFFTCSHNPDPHPALSPTATRKYSVLKKLTF